ncbi:MAG: hypothetical protein ACRD2C_02920 [Acidimicrobiales bacterium]
MAQGAIATEFRRNETVRALDDLPGVPKGTRGRVLLVDGFTWTRYRVAFENGYDLGSIDGSHLSRAKQYDAAIAQRERAAEPAAVEVDDGDSGEAAVAAAGEGAVVNGVTIPAHLLERSKRARERLTASA